MPFLERESCKRHGVMLVYTSSVSQAMLDDYREYVRAG